MSNCYTGVTDITLNFYDQPASSITSHWSAGEPHAVLYNCEEICAGDPNGYTGSLNLGVYVPHAASPPTSMDTRCLLDLLSTYLYENDLTGADVDISDPGIANIITTGEIDAALATYALSCAVTGPTSGLWTLEDDPCSPLSLNGLELQYTHPLDEIFVSSRVPAQNWGNGALGYWDGTDTGIITSHSVTVQNNSCRARRVQVSWDWSNVIWWARDPDDVRGKNSFNLSTYYGLNSSVSPSLHQTTVAQTSFDEEKGVPIGPSNRWHTQELGYMSRTTFVPANGARDFSVGYRMNNPRGFVNLAAGIRVYIHRTAFLNVISID